MNTCLKCSEETDNPKFCSRSCSVSYSNANRDSRLRGSCKQCDQKISASRKFCSSECYSHWRREQHGGFVVGKTKYCSSCKEIKDLAEFGFNKTNPDGLMRQCRICNNSRVNEFNKLRKTTPATQSQYKRHGLTLEQYQNLLPANYCCPICDQSFNEVLSVIDHDHTCCDGPYGCKECVRGVLCVSCNRGLGIFKDSVDIFNQAMLYLTRTGVREAEGTSFTH